MKVTLRHVKRICKLEFEIPQTGVWIIAGLNGCGKTTLFAALHRIRNQYAFQNNYRSGKLHNRVDSYANSEIDYTLPEGTVTYHYRGQRWRATPRKNASLLNKSAFPHVAYVEANGKRIEPLADEIVPRRIRPASLEMRQFLKEILTDDKWDKLGFVNTTRGRGHKAYLIPYEVNGNTYYYSEKNFSLGELCVLKLAQQLFTIPHQSLVLIDEVEMALHPQAQVCLFNMVRAIATERSLTILFSTHSATLIKSAPKNNLILLKAHPNGIVDCMKSVFPAQILGDIAFDDELLTDFILYVEDDEAERLANELIRFYLSQRKDCNAPRPLYKIVPAGGFINVLEMLAGSSAILPNYVKRLALLDLDAKDELDRIKRNPTASHYSVVNQTDTRTNFLPCTPEVGLISMLETDTNSDKLLLDKINTIIEGQRINVQQILSSPEYQQLTNSQPRKKAKVRLQHFIQKVVMQTRCDENHLSRLLYAQYVKHKFADAGSVGKLCASFGPIFNSK